MRSVVSTCLAASLVVSAVSASSVSQTPGTITELKPLYPTTPLVATDGAVRCVVVTPDDPAVA